MSLTNKVQELLIGLVSVSDRASGGVYEDKGIPALREWLEAALVTPFRIETRLIPDDRASIEATLVDLVDVARCHLVLTTGGTGPARRDVTPEATLAIGTKEMPGFGEQMRQISLHFVPTAILSRQTAVIRETEDHAALVMNLPGQPKSIKETLQGLKDAAGKHGRRRHLRGRPLLHRPDRRSVQRHRSGRLQGVPTEIGAATHQGQGMSQLLEHIQIETRPNPEIAIIWMHGLGADGNDFVPIVRELDLGGLPGIRFIFPHARTMPVTINGGYVMRSWYDITNADLVRREDETGLRASQQEIEAFIAREKARHPGFAHHPGRLLAGLRDDHPDRPAPSGNAGRHAVPVGLCAAGRQAGRRAQRSQPGHAGLHGPRTPGQRRALPARAAIARRAAGARVRDRMA
jgi:molybdenum cofactor synthesis domain-containing protein